MLSNNTLKLLKTVGEECKGCEYKVFSFSELSLLFPKELNVDEQGVRENIEYLAEHGFLSVKYIDEYQVCLSIIDKGRQAIASERKIDKSSVKKSNNYFLSAFWGAFIGGVVVSLIAMLLFFVFGGV